MVSDCGSVVVGGLLVGASHSRLCLLPCRLQYRRMRCYVNLSLVRSVA
jgi:hypothetical protein